MWPGTPPPPRAGRERETTSTLCGGGGGGGGRGPPRDADAPAAVLSRTVADANRVVREAARREALGLRDAGRRRLVRSAASSAAVRPALFARAFAPALALLLPDLFAELVIVASSPATGSVSLAELRNFVSPLGEAAERGEDDDATFKAAMAREAAVDLGVRICDALLERDWAGPGTSAEGSGGGGEGGGAGAAAGDGGAGAGAGAGARRDWRASGRRADFVQGLGAQERQLLAVLFMARFEA